MRTSRRRLPSCQSFWPGHRRSSMRMSPPMGGPPWRNFSPQTLTASPDHGRLHSRRTRSTRKRRVVLMSSARLPFPGPCCAVPVEDERVVDLIFVAVLATVMQLPGRTGDLDAQLVAGAGPGRPEGCAVTARTAPARASRDWLRAAVGPQRAGLGQRRPAGVSRLGRCSGGPAGPRRSTRNQSECFPYLYLVADGRAQAIPS